MNNNDIKPETQNKRTRIKRPVLIILFAIIFSFIVQDGIRVVIQKFLEIPIDYIGLAQWGDTFFLRIFASLIGTAAGAFVIGTFLKTKARLAAIIATLPTVLFWTVILILSVTIWEQYLFENIKITLFLPSILIILSPVVGYFGARWGQGYFDKFQRSKSILNIKWFHWFWILPFYLNKIVAVPLFTLILLWKIDWLYDTSGFYPGILDLISNWSYYLVRIVMVAILIGLFVSLNHVYSLLSEEIMMVSWKKGIIIFGHVLLFSILYIWLFPF